MSWPDDGEPRFIVASVTGFAVNQHAKRINSRRIAPTIYQVLDRAYAHALVSEFAPGEEKGLFRSLRHRQRAEHLCDDLNRQDTEGLFDRDLTDTDIAPGVLA